MFPLYKDNVIFCNIKIKDTVFARERKHADILCPKRCHANVLNARRHIQQPRTHALFSTFLAGGRLW